MEIVSVRALRGPNYWSIDNPQLIVVELNVTEKDKQIKVAELYNRLSKLSSFLNTHTNSIKEPDTLFNQQVIDTPLIPTVEHVAMQLQALVGCSIPATSNLDKKGRYQVVFPYQYEAVGLRAAKVAVNIVQALINDDAYDAEQDIEALKELVEDNKFGPSTGAIVNEAQRRNIPIIRLDDDAYVQFGYGAKQKRIEASIASTTSNIAVDLVGDKHRTKRILKNNFVPVPDGVIVTNIEDLYLAIEEVGYPIVIKPLDGNQGKGATTNILTLSCAVDAFHRAQKFSRKVIVEKYATGSDFRALVINHQFVAAARRQPASVVGDGTHTIQELIDITNQNPQRGNGHGNILTKISVDDDTLDILKANNYTLETVLQKGINLKLKTTANLSTGGTAEDVTDNVHPDNVALFERIARIVNLDICGIDIIAPDLSVPVADNGGVIIEVNAAPGLRMHLQPTIGQPRNVAEPIIDMLFPNGDNGRIPIISVTGTNGKTTTTRLVAFMMQEEGFNTGYTTTDGIYLNKACLYKGDCSGPSSAKVVLSDKAVEAAVLECARGGMLRSGLGFDTCDCAIVTNVAEDHLGLNGIDTIEDLAQVKSVLPQTVKKDGYAILNADDDLVYRMKEKLSCNIALFSLNAGNQRIREHCAEGGLAAVYEEGYLVIKKGKSTLVIDRVINIPITCGGKAKFNIANVLGSVLAAYVTGVSLSSIRNSLNKFQHSPELTPGRMNEFSFKDFKVIVDYAHNPHGLRAFGEYINALEASPKRGIITGVGDRREEDIIALGEEAAKIFDEIIIRTDADLRGRTETEICSLLTTGVRNIDGSKCIQCFPAEMDAIDHALHTAQPKSCTVVFADDVSGVCAYVKQQAEQSYAMDGTS